MPHFIVEKIEFDFEDAQGTIDRTRAGIYNR